MEAINLYEYLKNCNQPYSTDDFEAYITDSFLDDSEINQEIDKHNEVIANIAGKIGEDTVIDYSRDCVLWFIDRRFEYCTKDVCDKEKQVLREILEKELKKILDI